MSQNYTEQLRKDNVRDAIYEDLQNNCEALRTSWSGNEFPANPKVGQPCYRVDEDKLYYWDGYRWSQKGGGGSAALKSMELAAATSERVSITLEGARCIDKNMMFVFVDKIAQDPSTYSMNDDGTVVNFNPAIPANAAVTLRWFDTDVGTFDTAVFATNAEFTAGTATNKAPTVKQVRSGLVTLDTVQTVSAAKVFTAEAQRKSTEIDITTAAESYVANNAVGFQDKNGRDMGHVESAVSGAGIHASVMAKNKDSYQASVGVVVPQSGTSGAYGIAPTPNNDAPSNAITNIDYLKNYYNPLVSKRAEQWEGEATKLLEYMYPSQAYGSNLINLLDGAKAYAFDPDTYTVDSNGFTSSNAVSFPFSFSIKAPTAPVDSISEYFYVFPLINRTTGKSGNFFLCDVEYLDFVYDDTLPEPGHAAYYRNTGIIKLCISEGNVDEVGLPLCVLKARTTPAGNSYSLVERFDCYGYLSNVVFALPTFKSYTAIGSDPNNFNETYTTKSSYTNKIFAKPVQAGVPVELWSYTAGQTITDNDSLVSSETPPTSGSGVWYDTVNRKTYYCQDWSNSLAPVYEVYGYNFGNFCTANFPRLTLYRRNSINTYSRHELAQMGMPSKKFITLILGATGTLYAAPANGYFVLWIKNGSGYTGNVSLRDNENKIGSGGTVTLSGYTLFRCPARKGTKVVLYYDGSPNSNDFLLQFVYADGEL